MPVYLSRHHDREVTTLQLLRIAEFEAEYTLIFCDDVHGDISANRYHYFQDIPERHWAGVVYLLSIFSFSILDESDSVVAYNESSEYRIAVVASTSVSALASDIIANINFFRRFETVLVQIVLTFESLIHIFNRGILWFGINVVVLYHHSVLSCAITSRFWNPCGFRKQIWLSLFCLIKVVRHAFHFVLDIFLWLRRWNCRPAFHIGNATWLLYRTSCLLHSILRHCIHCVYLLHHSKWVESLLNLLLFCWLTHF